MSELRGSGPCLSPEWASLCSTNLGGNVTRHAGASARGGDAMRCIRCGVLIAYGDRCEKHKQELRQRKRRKLR